MCKVGPGADSFPPKPLPAAVSQSRRLEGGRGVPTQCDNDAGQIHPEKHPPLPLRPRVPLVHTPLGWKEGFIGAPLPPMKGHVCTREHAPLPNVGLKALVVLAELLVSTRCPLAGHSVIGGSIFRPCSLLLSLIELRSWFSHLPVEHGIDLKALFKGRQLLFSFWC